MTRAREVLLLVLLVSVAVVVVGAARGTGGLQPPVIDDGLGGRPCPSDPVQRQTTLGMQDCLGQRIAKTNAKINGLVKAVFTKLDDTGRRKLIAAERAWLTYRDLSCRSRADSYRGGSIQPVIYLECVASRNDVHARDLAGFLVELRHR